MTDISQVFGGDVSTQEGATTGHDTCQHRLEIRAEYGQFISVEFGSQGMLLSLQRCNSPRSKAVKSAQQTTWHAGKDSSS
jgi:hypothetical protein